MADLSVNVQKGYGRSGVMPIGNVSFLPSTGDVLYYEARVYAEGTSTPVVATHFIGLPTPGEDGRITVNIRSTLDALPAGNYEVTIAAVGGEGTSESAHGSAYVVPLQAP